MTFLEYVVKQDQNSTSCAYPCLRISVNYVCEHELLFLLIQ